ncbi:GNAT family N-acetyltransferase [Altericroceibacterium endophyticum]|uniref:GNAT family N-acetyltransferase n=1 Tax=Altericroceibacterium endophyticum TaxID=1808508 RepID=A0A6I4T928_9SPHN|nr:GNAT family N-acetyltransferase [Altericroceibacterium endophyticum]MXO66899.1 GNAT family N-acetyltransferase [Altericroceibacterium endophyticum]
MFIRTQNLFLRPAFAEDWPALFAGIAQEKVVRMLARAPWPYHAQHARAFIAQPAEPLYPSLLVTLPAVDGAPIIGGAGISNETDGANLGYWIDPNWWGRGYASEAGAAMLEIAASLGHRRVVARHYPDNPASGRVLEKIGFHATGRSGRAFCKARQEILPTKNYFIDLHAPHPEAGDGARYAA